jgi:hypothetical protein
MEVTIIYPSQIKTLYETRRSAAFPLDSLIVKKITIDQPPIDQPPGETQLQLAIYDLLLEQWGEKTFDQVLTYYTLYNHVVGPKHEHREANAARAIDKLDGSGCLLIVRD